MRKNRCGAARVIWQKRRSSRTPGVGPGAWREEKPCISPRNGTAYMASIQKRACRLGKNGCSVRSEEHTSELQSRLHLVCRLLLEKKKNHTRAHPRGHSWL